MSNVAVSELVCLALDIHVWSGGRPLDRTQDTRNVSKDKLPPEKSSSPGRKYVFDQKLLQKIVSFRSKAERVCEAVGIRYVKGTYGIPKDKLKDVIDQLDEIKRDFNAMVTNFEKTYDQEFEKFVESHTKEENWWKQRLRQAKVPVERAMKRMLFGYQVFNASHVDESDNRIPQGINTHLDNRVAGLGDTLFNDIAKKAKETYENTFLKSERVSQKSLCHFHYMRNKMEGLAFLDARINPIIARIDHILSSLPVKGWIEGKDYDALTGLLALLSDVDRMKVHGKAVLNAQSNGISQESTPDESEEAIEETAEVIQFEQSTAEKTASSQESDDDSSADEERVAEVEGGFF